VPEMRIVLNDDLPAANEVALLQQRLSLHAARIVELGCGRAQLTRVVANAGRACSVLALEVDEVQLELNRQIRDLPNVCFAAGGAEAIPADEASFDIALLFKSLHHVPAASIPGALREIRRVLKPGGYAWISEPVFAGEFNEIVRIFHDERRVRELAFVGVVAAVAEKTFELVEQIFFTAPVEFRDYAEFERLVIGVTHTRHVLTPRQEEQVRERFARHATPAGVRFLQPMRVDLPRRPVSSVDSPGDRG
jgi:SAM-dependent methyltransferase